MTFQWVRDHLRAAGKQPGTPATEADFQAFSDIHRWALPAEIKAAYSVMNGSDYSTDEWTSWIRFWPLHEWKQAKTLFPNDLVAQSTMDGTFIIADDGIECVFYALCLNSSMPEYGQVLALGSTQLSTISQTFNAFIELVQEDSSALHNY